MALMIWNDKLAVGVQPIDAQHNVLVDALNELNEALVRGQPRSLTQSLLRNLLACTRDLFSTEEAMMADAKYPELEEHSIRHRDLTRKVEGYVARFERGEISLSCHLLNFMRDWLTNHIQDEDRAYIPCMNAHGIQ